MMNVIVGLHHTICVCSLFVTGVIGYIIQTPLNAATSVGGQSFFNCSTNNSLGVGAITWLHSTDCNFASGVQLTTGNCDLNNSYVANYKIDKPDGFSCNLIVYDAVMSLGRCYTCTDGAGQGRTANALLIIVDSIANITPNSTDVIPGEGVMITSTVSYRGPTIPSQPSTPLPPSFYWTPVSDPSQNITSHQGLTTDTSASSYIVVTAQKPSVPPYLCYLFFNTPTNLPPGCANNAPTYRTNFKSSIIEVVYPPENMNISEVTDGCPYKVPVVLTCSASGYPVPTYQWIDLTNGVDLPKGSIVSIDYPGIYQCVASNTIRDVQHTVSMLANVSNCFGYVPVPPSKCETECIIILVICIYFGLNLLFFVIFMICYGSKNGRIQLNDRFPWLEDMLPCMNSKGCECSVWIFYFVLLSIFVAFVFFPTILIMASCCKKKTKTSQGNNRNMPLSERNGRGVGGAQVIISGQPISQYPPRTNVTPNPPSSLDTSILSLPEHPMHTTYPHSSDQQRQPTHWGNSADPYHQTPRPLQIPRHTPSPALSSGAIVYAELGVDNQPKSRRPIQPIQNEGNPYADIAIA